MNILVGITGGIAAYKSAELIRRLRDQQHQVQVVMTKAAEAFITPLTLQAVSGNPVRTSLLDAEAEAGMGHIELARWADMIVIAPASADFLAKATHGLANDLLSTVCLASDCPIALVPAMNQAMWRNHATQRNIELIKHYPHCRLWGPASGQQACGDTGPGRMLEPSEIVDHIKQTLESLQGASEPAYLKGKTVLVTAGPTREAIDPVRYLSNESSGKMGYALADAAAKAGANVILVSGPTRLPPPKNVARIDVVSAREMDDVCQRECTQADIIIGAAAVADYRPAEAAKQKLKKGQSDTLQLSLIKNPDIIANMATKAAQAYIVGFAAETQNLEVYAKGKLETKGLDMIIANDVSQSAIGFNSDFNSVTVLWRAGMDKKVDKKTNKRMAKHTDEQGIQRMALTKMTKHALATKLIQAIAEQIS